MKSIINSQKWNESVRHYKKSFFKTCNDLDNSLEFTVNYSYFYKTLVSSILQNLSLQQTGNIYPKGIVVYSFGAPSRNEMVGSSDADIIIFRKDNSNDKLLFRKKFIEVLSNFGFTKIDTPEWGSVEDIIRYLNTSVTEANQIIEAQFIGGDLEFMQEIEKVRKENYQKQIIARNLLFQFNYFSHYYKQKEKENEINLKYCHGGVRDLLFPMWYSHLTHGLEKNLTIPAVKKGLETLYEKGFFNKREEISDCLKKIANLIFIRNELIDISNGDTDGILTYEKAQKLYKKYPKLFTSQKDIFEKVNDARKKIKFIKKSVWLGLKKYFHNTHTLEWNTCFEVITMQNTFSKEDPFQKDEIINCSRIWKINSKNLEKNINYLKHQSKSNSWIVLSSILSNPNTPGDILHSIIEKVSKKKGFEYLYEIVTRNPNVFFETILLITKKKDVEIRFKKAAIKMLQELARW